MKEKFVKYLDSYIEECRKIKELSKAKEEVSSPDVKLLMDAQKEEKVRSLEAIRSLIKDELLSLEKEALEAPVEEEVVIDELPEGELVSPEEIAEEVKVEEEKEPEIEKTQEEPQIEDVKQEEAPAPKVVKKAVKRSIYRIKE